MLDHLLNKRGPHLRSQSTLESVTMRQYGNDLQISKIGKFDGGPFQKLQIEV